MDFEFLQLALIIKPLVLLQTISLASSSTKPVTESREREMFYTNMNGTSLTKRQKA